MSETHNAMPILAQPERKITIYSTKNGDKKSITTNATSWGELKSLIRREVGIDTDKFLATETISKMTYEVDDIALPASSFYLIIRPKDTKAGAKAVLAYPLNRKEIMASLKEAFAIDASLKDKLGGNMTQVKTPELEAFHKKYIAGKTIKTPKAVAAKAVIKKETPVKKEAAPKKETSKTSKAVKAPAKATPTKKEIKTPTKEVKEKKAPIAKKNVADVVDTVAKAKEKEEPSPEELIKADKEETDFLAQEAKKLFKR